MSIGWQFPHNGGGSAQGFSDGAIDTFAEGVYRHWSEVYKTRWMLLIEQKASLLK